MIVVVSDTSPIRALTQLGLVHLLTSFYDEILIPSTVALELSPPESRLPPLNWQDFPKIRLQSPSDPSQVNHFLLEGLHRGESEALALALEIHAAAVLVDERAARQAAIEAGLKTIGVLGMLVRAKQENLIASVKPLMDRLRSELGFYISPALYAEIAARAGE